MAAAPLRNAPLLDAAQLRSRLDEFYRALEEFNAGYYFEAHETLEDLWMVTPLPERTLFQGVIQLAAAFVHVSRREHPGAIKLLDAAAEKLAGFAPAALGVDVAALLRAVAAARAELLALGPDGVGRWDPRRQPKVSFRSGDAWGSPGPRAPAL